MTHSPSLPVTQTIIDNVDHSLKRAPICISNSTTQLRKAYQQDQSNLSDDTLKYRRQLYSEGIMYGTKVYPGALELVKDIQEILENYIHLDFSTFEYSLEDIRAECLTHSKRAVKVQAGHTYVLGNLKRLENEMRRSIVELQNHAEIMRSKANTRKRQGEEVMQLGKAVAAAAAAVDGGLTLAVIAAIGGAFIGTRLCQKASKAEKRAVAALQNVALLHQLVESLEGLVEAVDLVASFVALLASELYGLSRIGVGMMAKFVHWRKMTRDAEIRKVHWMKMTGKAQMLVGSCQAFITVEPKITSDLLSIKENLDDGYVEQWVQGLHKTRLLEG